ncbi:MAG TPA: TIGR03435 family protein [Bryobacteraceae bacterium]|jgi:uncharacterized protein (TIGR03435 family)
MTRKLFLGILPGFAGLTAAQTAPSFDVASIKLHPEPITMSIDPSVRGRTVSGMASTLLDLITNAYGVKYDQISGGPAWIKSDHYDVTAKSEGEGTLAREQAQQMMQTLLADRFQLKIHRETRTVPVYALVMSKNGAKLKPSSAGAPGNNFVRAGAAGLHMEATQGTMERLAAQLSGSAGRPVIDKTGLTGFYAYTLDWLSPNQTATSTSDIPDVFTAVQEQLGLKLEPTTGPREILIIDRAEKPSGN